MANNRLYIENTETKEKILLAKSFGQWSLRVTAEELDGWLSGQEAGERVCIQGGKTKLRLVTEDELNELDA